MGNYGNDEYLQHVALSRARHYGELPTTWQRIKRLEDLVLKLTMELGEAKKQLAIHHVILQETDEGRCWQCFCTLLHRKIDCTCRCHQEEES